MGRASASLCAGLFVLAKIGSGEQRRPKRSLQVMQNGQRLKARTITKLGQILIGTQAKVFRKALLQLKRSRSLSAHRNWETFPTKELPRKRPHRRDHSHPQQTRQH
jgi:hypothetical protein